MPESESVRMPASPKSTRDETTRDTLVLEGSPDQRAAALDDYLMAEMSARRLADRAVLIGLSGPQGSGKSTISARISKKLVAAGIPALVCSLDDFYLAKAERHRLAQQVHPLLMTRGVPGTHDIALMAQTIDRLRSASPDTATSLPSFDKMADDRLPDSAWPIYQGRPDIILIEGWCIGAHPESPDRLVAPVNDLECSEDADGRWRRYVNEALSGDYARLFALLDWRIAIRAPDFGIVHRWRDEQEEELACSQGRPRSMDARQIARFIAHYERLTRWMMEDAPADLLIDLEEDRVPRACRARQREFRA